MGFPGVLVGKESAWNAGNHLQCRRPRLNPWVRKIPWRRKWQPTPVLLPGKSHGRRRVVGYSPWGPKESDMTERLHFLSLSLPFSLLLFFKHSLCLLLFLFVFLNFFFGVSFLCNMVKHCIQRVLYLWSKPHWHSESEYGLMWESEDLTFRAYLFHYNLMSLS